MILIIFFSYRAAPLGSIKDLAAESCSEIMASEGDEMAKNEHWIYSEGNGGQVILAKCEGTAFFKSLPTLNLECFDPFSQGVPWELAFGTHHLQTKDAQEDCLREINIALYSG